MSRILKVPILEMGTLKLREIVYLAKDATGARILTEICQTRKAVNASSNVRYFVLVCWSRP